MDTLSFSHLVAQIYESACNPENWRIVLDRLAAKTGAQQITLIQHNFRWDSHSVDQLTQFEPRFQREYETHYGHYDVWAISSRSRPSGWHGSGFELWPESEMVRTEFYNDLLHRMDLHYLYGVQILNCEDEVAGLTLMRSYRAGDFDSDTSELFEILTPHLQQAIQIRRRLGVAEGRGKALEVLLDKSSQGVILLDFTGRVVFENASATQLLRTQDGVRLRDCQLETCDAESCRILKALVTECIATSSGTGTGIGGAIAVQRRKAKQLLLRVMPIRENLAFSPVQPAVLVFLSNSTLGALTLENELRQLFRLTPAESRLVTRLGGGLGLRGRRGFANHLRDGTDAAEGYLV